MTRSPAPIPCTIDRVAVVLPARDERRTIADALISIGRAAERVGPEVVCHVTLIDDGSVDATGAIASAVLSRFDVEARVIRIDAGCVGVARRVGVDVTTSTWRRSERAWILSTDADSLVRPDWIVRHLGHAREGGIAVSGIVDIVADGLGSDMDGGSVRLGTGPRAGREFARRIRFGALAWRWVDRELQRPFDGSLRSPRRNRRSASIWMTCNRSR